MWVPGRIDHHHAVLVEQRLVALDEDGQIGAVPEAQPSAAVGEDIGTGGGGHVQRRAHAAAAFLVARGPGRTRRRQIAAGLAPQAQLGRMRAALVAARDEGGAGGAHLAQRLGDGRALDPGRIGGRADQNEVVVHDRHALESPALGDELLLGHLVMHEDDVGVAAARHVQRLAGADGHDTHLDAAGGLEARQQVREQARLLGRGGRGHDDRLRRVLRGREARQHRGHAQHRGRHQAAAQRLHARARAGIQVVHGNSPLRNWTASGGSGSSAGASKKRAVGRSATRRPPSR